MRGCGLYSKSLCSLCVLPPWDPEDLFHLSTLRPSKHINPPRFPSKEIPSFFCGVTPSKNLAAPQPLNIAFPLGNGGVLRSEEGEGLRKEGDGGVGEKRRKKGRAKSAQVRVYPAECGKQLGRDPSKNGSSTSLVLRVFLGREHFGTRPFQSPSLSGIRLYFVRPHFPSPKAKEGITQSAATLRARD